MPKQIFIVDDSQIVRRLVRACVESRLEYVACVEARDGMEAVERAREVKPDLIILDLCMPKLNGLEAAAILHNMLPKVPIILFTLHEGVVSERRAQAAGIRAVVSKTDRMEILIENILNFVGVAKAATV